MMVVRIDVPWFSVARGYSNHRLLLGEIMNGPSVLLWTLQRCLSRRVVISLDMLTSSHNDPVANPRHRTPQIRWKYVSACSTGPQRVCDSASDTFTSPAHSSPRTKRIRNPLSHLLPTSWVQFPPRRVTDPLEIQLLEIVLPYQKTPEHTPKEGRTIISEE